VAIVDIDRLDWSQAVVAKVNSKHHLTIDDVESAVENYELMAWDHHHQHGTRLLCEGQDRARWRGSSRAVSHGLDRSLQRRDGVL